MSAVAIRASHDGPADNGRLSYGYLPMRLKLSRSARRAESSSRLTELRQALRNLDGASCGAVLLAARTTLAS